MRRLLVVLALVVLLTAGVGAYLLTRPPSGPFPSAGHLTLTRAPGDGAAFAGVILYEDGHVVSAYYAPFSI